MFDTGAYRYFEDVNWGLLRLWGQKRGLDVLDVGCGYATTSARIETMGNRVTGIESSPQAVAVARRRLAEVVELDLQQIDDVWAALGARRFDAILFADVLEHLAWPVESLRQYAEFLKPGGFVMVSLPNVGLWSVRLAHLFGRFEYQDTGVLDRTHLRFFTRRSARHMMEEAGLRIEATTYNPGLVRPFVPLAKSILGGGAADPDPASLLHSTPYRIYLKTVYPAERAVGRLWPGGLAFQMILRASRPS
jgi:2-polyprenyl-3-methyl-5-hydroxy-6-metoxy-1,4-benzoquinol methylase